MDEKPFITVGGHTPDYSNTGRQWAVPSMDSRDVLAYPQDELECLDMDGTAH